MVSPRRFVVPSVLRASWLLVLGGVLAVGVVACDSTGSNEEEEEERTVAKTFNVTVEPIEGTDYPYSDQNQIGVAYAIDGEVGKVITLERGKTYEFSLGPSVDDGPNGNSHPFYVGETAEGAGGDEYGEGTENEKVTTGSVYFTPPSDAPSTLYYQCDFHSYMGGKMELVDSGSSSSGTGGSDY